MSTSTISKAEDHSRMKDLDETFEEKYVLLLLLVVYMIVIHTYIIKLLLTFNVTNYNFPGTQN